MTRRVSSYRWRLVSIVVSVFVALVAVEAGLRIVAHRRDERNNAALDKGPIPVPRHLRYGAIAPLLQWSDDPKQIYELRPRLDAMFVGARVRTNADGFRGPEISSAPLPNAVRIVGLGDSVMFGWGVEDNDTYLAQLNRILTERFPAVHWECINTGVPGYNTAMEIETLKVKALALRPDIVVLGYVWNDPAAPPFFPRKTSLFTLHCLFVHDLLRDGFTNAMERLRDPMTRSTGGESDWDPQRVPEPYRILVGTSAVQHALEELKALSESRRFHVLVMAQTDAPDYLKAMCNAAGLSLVEPSKEEPFRSRLQATPLGDVRHSWYPISPTESHPSKLSHRLYAELLFNELSKRGWLEESSKAAGPGRPRSRILLNPPR